jgi:uncharacterized membrane-anchored protein YjiN (DUF445 family)
LVGDRIHRELMDFTDKVRRDPNHELRQSATRFLFEFADDLQNDPLTIAKAESVKEQLMARDEVTRAAETAWRTLKRLVLEGVDDPSSTLRAQVADSVVRIGESLRDDAELRDKVDNWIVRGAQHLVASTAWRSPRSSPRPSSAGTPRTPAGGSNCTSGATCSSSGSTAPWWAPWPA